jgi:U3 small nucleolar RNA-associated protein 3
MGKKRKAGGKPPGELREDQTRQNVQTRYHVDEQFADSEDDFFAGRDKILLEEGPASKRRRKAEEEGRACSIDRFIRTTGADKTYRTIPSALRRGSLGLR